MDDPLFNAINVGEAAANQFLNEMKITAKNRSRAIYNVAYGGCESTAIILFGKIKSMSGLSFQAFWGDFYNGLCRATEHSDSFLQLFLNAPIEAGLLKDEIDEGMFYGFATTTPFAAESNRELLLRWFPVKSDKERAGLKMWWANRDGDSSNILEISKHPSKSVGLTESTFMGLISAK